MSFLDRIFGDRRERAALQPLYDRIVASARDPLWYREGQVPDTIDGRFDMVSSILALVLLRLEREGKGEDGAARRSEVLLTEVFIDDMDGTVRQLGIGDQVVGKHVGKMMSALGGRLGAYRDAGGDGGGDAAAFEGAVRRNIFRDEPPSDEAVKSVAARLVVFRTALEAVTLSDLLAGRLSQP